MALAVILRGSQKLPALGNAASKILATQSVKSSLVLTPIVARNFTALNKPSLIGNHGIVNNNMIQTRNMNHAKIWAAEKILSVALLGIIPVCAAFPSPMMNNILALSVVLHMHWGIEAVLCDYLRPSLVGHTLSKITIVVVHIISAITLAGLLYFNFNDVGIAQAVSMVWKDLGKPPPHVHEMDYKRKCCKNCDFKME